MHVYVYLFLYVGMYVRIYIRMNVTTRVCIYRDNYNGLTSDRLTGLFSSL